MSVQQQKFKEIADKIREKTGETNIIKPSDFANKIDEVYNAGKNAGGGGGSYEQGFADGKQAEYDRFWDAFQENGNRSAYQNSFTGWTDACYAPKYPITIKSGIAAFNNSKITNTKVPITISMATATTIFANSISLVTIPHLDVSNVTNLIDRCFSSTNALENLTMLGSINANGFDVSPCKKLTHDSLVSIIEALADKTADTSGTQWVCTLGTDNLNKLTDAEKAIATTEKGWVLA